MPSKKRRPTIRAAPKPTMDEILASRERLNRASTNFLKIDIETALTFLRAARQTTDATRRRRNQAAALRAFNTVTKLMERVNLSHEDVRTIVLGLEQLRSELEELGEVL